MSDDISLFHRRMRKPAALALVIGFGLGIISIQAQRLSTGSEYPWILAIPYGLIAAAMLYGVMYQNISKRLANS